MDFEKKYNEALERAKELLLGNEHSNTIRSYFEHIFPELRGSEDERIRNWLIDYFSSIKKTVWIHRDITCEQILEWLEKQKEPTTEELYAEAGTTEKEYIANTMKMVRAMREKQKEHVPENEESGTRKEQKPEIKYVYPKFRKGDVIEPITPNGHYEPVRVVGIWDGSYSCRSDDDKTYLSLPIKHEDEYRLVEQKPAEWSEEDEEMAMKIDCYLSSAIGVSEDERQSIDNWLKSLRPSWKPSEEQMRELKNAVNELCRNGLASLHNDLQKLCYENTR